MNNGKALRESLNVDIPLASNHFRYMTRYIIAEEDISNIMDEKYLSVVVREPIGVVLVKLFLGISLSL